MTEVVNSLVKLGELVDKIGFWPFVGIAVIVCLIILTRAVINFLTEIVNIRRQIVAQVSESRQELALQRNDLRAVLVAINGLRSDVQETIRNVILMMINRSSVSAYEEILRNIAIQQPGESRHGD